jgi:S-adenosylmethionine-diacylglycerol 3-amino-3-carboxypropyl transferase
MPAAFAGIAANHVTVTSLLYLSAEPPHERIPALKREPTLTERIDQRIFDAIYARSLVYNTCWEDPAVDRRALQLGPDDKLLVITSAGCNVLDYALTAPRHIYAVDANPRQTALLELKMAGIRRLDFGDFFSVFGTGYHERFGEVYRDVLRADLSDFARAYWDRNAGWFVSRQGSFYYHGLSGLVARLFRTYLALRPGLAEPVKALFETTSLDEQRRLYDEHIQPQLWRRGINWALSRQLTMSLLGVPTAQRREVQAQHADGVAGFVRDSIEYVFRQLPVWDNYFWSVYVRGRYGESCCPEYLKRDNFQALKDGLVDRVSAHTCTVTNFLHSTPEAISRFVLLDHMDWMSSVHPAALREEWDAIFDRATPNARIIFRSAHARPAYLEQLEVGGHRLRDRLHFDDALAARLQREDRVHTYAGFHIAAVPA